ncbi:MAG: serine/threonine protein kinase, partial [Thermoleophilia bacterium]|nr:serine/threonine protein kinase [Thermoleophilia bacterium]
MDDAWPEIDGYELLDELGRGGMGVVYRARRRSDGAPRALKVMLRGRDASLSALARFRIEAEALACLKHPNIIRVRDIGVHRGIPYFAMDYAAGGSLKSAQAADPGPWPARRAAELVRTLALAIDHAHGRGMLHRDLKPANILLTEEGQPVVSDFGLVKFASPIGEVSEMYCTR